MKTSPFFWLVSVGIFSLMSSLASIFFVDLTFIRCNFMCPLSVSLDSGKGLLTDFTVIPRPHNKISCFDSHEPCRFSWETGCSACKYLMAPGIDGRDECTLLILSCSGCLCFCCVGNSHFPQSCFGSPPLDICWLLFNQYYASSQSGATPGLKISASVLPPNYERTKIANRRYSVAAEIGWMKDVEEGKVRFRWNSRIDYSNTNVSTGAVGFQYRATLIIRIFRRGR